DGRDDIAVATAIGVKLLLNRTVRGSTSLVLDALPADPGQVLVPGVGPFGIAVADMDRDGRQDLVVSDAFADSISVARASGNGYQLVTSPVSLSGRPGGLVAADFTGDGIPDVAVTRNAAARIAVLENDGRGRLQPWLEEPVGPAPGYLQSADFDGDGLLDLA